MPNESVAPESDAKPNDAVSTWHLVKRIADELQLKLHLAGMDARDRWNALEPRLAALEQWFSRTSERAGDAIAKELSAVEDVLRKLRDDVGNGR